MFDWTLKYASYLKSAVSVGCSYIESAWNLQPQDDIEASTSVSMELLVILLEVKYKSRLWKFDWE